MKASLIVAFQVVIMSLTAVVSPLAHAESSNTEAVQFLKTQSEILEAEKNKFNVITESLQDALSKADANSRVVNISYQMAIVSGIVMFVGGSYSLMSGESVSQTVSGSWRHFGGIRNCAKCKRSLLNY